MTGRGRPEPLNKIRLPFLRAINGVFSICWVSALWTSTHASTKGSTDPQSRLLAHCGSIATVQLTALATSISNRMVFLSGPVQFCATQAFPMPSCYRAHIRQDRFRVILGFVISQIVPANDTRAVCFHGHKINRFSAVTAETRIQSEVVNAIYTMEHVLMPFRLFTLNRASGSFQALIILYRSLFSI